MDAGLAGPASAWCRTLQAAYAKMPQAIARTSAISLDSAAGTSRFQSRRDVCSPWGLGFGAKRATDDVGLEGACQVGAWATRFEVGVRVDASDVGAAPSTQDNVIRMGLGVVAADPLSGARRTGGSTCRRAGEGRRHSRSTADEAASPGGGAALPAIVTVSVALGGALAVVPAAVLRFGRRNAATTSAASGTVNRSSARSPGFVRMTPPVDGLGTHKGPLIFACASDLKNPFDPGFHPLSG